MLFELTVNGEKLSIQAQPEMPLLWILREKLGLTGTKFGCGIGDCGACAVHVDGKAVRSCVLPVQAVEGSQITTIEGLGAGQLHRVQRAWIAQQVPQCGYCQSGMIMAVAALLQANPDPTASELAGAVTNICRCGTYVRIRAAVAALGKQEQGPAP